MFHTYHRDHTTRSNTATHSHHAHVISVITLPNEMLVSHEVSSVVDHEATTLHPAGLAPAQVGGDVRAVTAGLIGATLEVPVLVQDYLKKVLKSFKH